MWGIGAAIGYGLGVLLAYVWRAFADRKPRPPQARGPGGRCCIGAAVLLPVFLRARPVLAVPDPRADGGERVQHLVRRCSPPLVAVLVFGLLLQASRGVRALYRRTAELLSRRVGRRAAHTVGWLLTAGLAYLVISGLLLHGFVDVINERLRPGHETAEGATPAHDRPALGRAGLARAVGHARLAGPQLRRRGPVGGDIEEFTHRPALEPIRTYAGLASADDAESRPRWRSGTCSARAVRRKDLLVVTTTGSGWVDPALVDSFEYLSGGDSATVAMQYSYLPSWISYLVDQSKAREAGRALFDAVYGVWSKLPPTPPRLFVAGESLGTFGGETAFSGETTWQPHRRRAVRRAAQLQHAVPEFSDHRDPGSPEVQPVYQDGRTCASRTTRTAIPPPAALGRHPGPLHDAPVRPDRLVEPAPDLRRADSISKPPGKDVLKGMFWMPFVTFWQVTADLPFATGVAGGHGHPYRPSTSTAGTPSCSPRLTSRTWTTSRRSSRPEVIAQQRGASAGPATVTYLGPVGRNTALWTANHAR